MYIAFDNYTYQIPQRYFWPKKKITINTKKRNELARKQGEDSKAKDFSRILIFIQTSHSPYASS